MKYENLEKRVHQQDSIGLDTAGIEQDRLRRTVETVAIQNRLDHDQTLRQIFPHQHVSVTSVNRITQNVDFLPPLLSILIVTDKTMFRPDCY